jgi:hypothetical protein
MFVGCFQNQTRSVSSTIIKTEKFDLDEAAKILQKTESCIIELIKARGGTKPELEERFKAVYGEEYREVLKLFFDDYYNEKEELSLIEDFNFFPTIYHVGIEISEAYIERYYDEETGELISEYLCIEEEFVGDKDKYVHLKDFSKGNWYTKDADGSWRFHRFSGNVNIGDGGAYYLEFK